MQPRLFTAMHFSQSNHQRVICFYLPRVQQTPDIITKAAATRNIPISAQTSRSSLPILGHRADWLTQHVLRAFPYNPTGPWRWAIRCRTLHPLVFSTVGYGGNECRNVRQLACTLWPQRLRALLSLPLHRLQPASRVCRESCVTATNSSLWLYAESAVLGCGRHWVSQRHKETKQSCSWGPHVAGMWSVLLGACIVAVAVGLSAPAAVQPQRSHKTQQQRSNVGTQRAQGNGRPPIVPWQQPMNHTQSAALLPALVTCVSVCQQLDSDLCALPIAATPAAHGRRVVDVVAQSCRFDV